MRGAIVDLDRSSRVRPGTPSDRLAIVTLAAGCLLFALAVAIVSVRGRPGVAAAEGPAVVEWSEGGIVYSLRSSDRTTDELIRIAEVLR